MTETFDVVVIGGGQAGLATGHRLQRDGLVPGKDFIVLDAAERAGGAWQHMWSSMRLFSPPGYSSLPGMSMSAWPGDGNPDAAHVADYLAAYEERYALAVRRPVQVTAVRNDGDALLLDTSDGPIRSARVVNATGSWTRPWVPTWRGLPTFPGRQVHTVTYTGPEEFIDQRVAVIGGGNSAAQILAEASAVADTRWVTRRRPRFMADEVDGAVLFQFASARHRSSSDGQPGSTGVPDLGDIVMVESVFAAREMGVLVAHRPFDRFDGADLVWDQGSRWTADAVIWCTGFRPELRHLRGTGLVGADRRVEVDGVTSVADPRLRFVGYGDWTGHASATLVGVGRTVREIVAGPAAG